MLASLQTWLCKSATTGRTTARHIFRPTLEALEDRSLCSATLVTNTTADPNRAVAHVTSWFDANRNGRQDKGEVFSASAAMIGPDSALTAAHVVYDPNLGGFATSVTIAPGQNGANNRPFGSYQALNWVIPSMYKAFRSDPFDVAVLNFRQLNGFASSFSIGNTTGWFGYQSYSNSDLAGSIVNNIGYPAETHSGTQQYRSAGTLIQVAGSKWGFGNLEFANKDLSVEHGSSGSPIYKYFPATGQRLIVGVVSDKYEDGTLAWATRITESVVSFIHSAQKLTGPNGQMVITPFTGMNGVSIPSVGIQLAHSTSEGLGQANLAWNGSTLGIGFSLSSRDMEALMSNTATAFGSSSAVQTIEVHAHTAPAVNANHDKKEISTYFAAEARNAHAATQRAWAGVFAEAGLPESSLKMSWPAFAR